MESRVRQLSRRQLDDRLDRIREIGPALRAPGSGWISALRNALGMTQPELARRMDMTQQAVAQVEKRESEGSTTLKALEAAAQAFDAELVYAIVPRRPLSEVLEDRALELARRMTGSVRHSMKLEDQEPASDLDERTRELAEELLADPRRLWSQGDA